MAMNRLTIDFGTRKTSFGSSESPPVKKLRLELGSFFTSPDFINSDFRHLSNRNRRPLGELQLSPQTLSPNAVSKPVDIPAVPKIAIHYDENDEVFEEDKENVYGSGRKTLFPSYGTSPGHALKLSSNTLDDFSPTSVAEDSQKKKLGQGSFGTVVLGVLHGERVAMKIIKRRNSLDNELNAQALDHENVTKIKNVKFREDCSILVMEYVGQNNLQTLLVKKSKNLKENKVNFLQQICSGLKHCHDKNIAHLDLKPANILITSKGLCKIADFGCSKSFQDASEQLNLVEDECIGTPGYQAPELFKDKCVSLKSDIFSLGIMTWQLITGESQPYPGWHPHTIIFKVVTEDVRPKTAPPAKLTKFFNLYSNCWNQDPFERPNARQVLQSVTKLSRTISNNSTLNISTISATSLSTSRKSSAGLRL